MGRRVPARVVRRHVWFVLLVLLPGTPYVLLEQEAQARVDARLAPHAAPAPRPNQWPDSEPRYQATEPEPSLADPVYPLNHAMDAEPVDLGVTTENHGFEDSPVTVGSPPTDYNFAAGNLTNWSPTGTTSHQTEAGGNGYAKLDASGTITSSQIDVDEDAQFLYLRLRGLTTWGEQYNVHLLSDPNFTTVVLVSSGSIADTWTTLRVNVAAHQDDPVKLKISRVGALGSVGVDDVGVQWVDFPDWETGDTGLATRVSGGPNGWYADTSGTLTSLEFGLDPEAQHLTFQYKAGQTGAYFHPELLTGPTFSTVIHLNGGVQVSGSTTEWKTFTAGVGLQATDPGLGEVKLRLRPGFGRTLFDVVGPLRLSEKSPLSNHRTRANTRGKCSPCHQGTDRPIHARPSSGTLFISDLYARPAQPSPNPHKPAAAGFRQVWTKG